MSLFERVVLTESKLSPSSLRVLQYLVDQNPKWHDTVGITLIEYPDTSNMPNRAGFGPQKKDYAPYCSVHGCGSRQIQALMKRGLIKSAGHGRHQITDKGRAALEASKK